jgi:hypothetical protein
MAQKQAIVQSNFFGLSIQSKSITNVGLTIRIQFSKWIDNPIQIQSQSKYFWKKVRSTNMKWQSFMMEPWKSSKTSLINLQPY